MDYCASVWMSKGGYGCYMEKYGKITNKYRGYERFFSVDWSFME